MSADGTSKQNGRPKRPHRKPTLEGLGPLIAAMNARGITVMVLIDDESEEPGR